ncbi:FAD-binding oxidoreductase [Erysipelothrix sp. HDW6A]|uniref:NAD(P)/FAD-dependent oxidoreductase n=1 Tax=Erysipelothrix sp. HDW6A TaxID=2714928 RepID=UPI0014078102|nr:FAD-dependent oxidoreductase [Erysipelothrix sp. HDW6A]QIK57152.1 FAD-binding oxidoreductase [Erysipelothrix sp. HDW6A]
MKKVGIIGAGIVGASAAFYLTRMGYEVKIYDAGYAQGTRAAVGIICPWVSQRRNKSWYDLANRGAHHYLSLIKDVSDDRFFKQNGTLITHDTKLDKQYNIALKNKENAPMMGEVYLLTKEEVQEKIPEGFELDEAIFVAGGAQVDGALLIDILLKDSQIKVIPKRVYLEDMTIDGEMFDTVIVAAGPWLNEAQSNEYDIKIQRGQLIALEAPEVIDSYPVIMPQGEADILFQENRIIIGATHIDLDTEKAYRSEEAMYLKHNVEAIIPNIYDMKEIDYRVGFRSVSRNHQAFFGPTDHNMTQYVVSGLGSSGLTVGPYIAYLIAQSINGKDIDFSQYSPHLYKGE